MDDYVVKFKHSDMQGWTKFGIIEAMNYHDAERIAKATIAQESRLNPSDIDTRAYKLP